MDISIYPLPFKCPYLKSPDNLYGNACLTDCSCSQNRNAECRMQSEMFTFIGSWQMLVCSHTQYIVKSLSKHDLYKNKNRHIDTFTDG